MYLPLWYGVGSLPLPKYKIVRSPQIPSHRQRNLNQYAKTAIQDANQLRQAADTDKKTRGVHRAMPATAARRDTRR